MDKDFEGYLGCIVTDFSNTAEKKRAYEYVFVTSKRKMLGYGHLKYELSFRQLHLWIKHKDYILYIIIYNQCYILCI